MLPPFSGSSLMLKLSDSSGRKGFCGGRWDSGKLRRSTAHKSGGGFCAVGVSRKIAGFVGKNFGALSKCARGIFC